MSFSVVDLNRIGVEWEEGGLCCFFAVREEAMRWGIVGVALKLHIFVIETGLGSLSLMSRIWNEG